MRKWAAGLIVTASSCAATMEVRAATHEQVEQALAKAKTWIYSQQKNGNWELTQQRDTKKPGHDIEGGQFGGVTALNTYALLAAGENPTDPRIQQAVDFLRKADMVGVYGLGMRAQVWHFLPKTPENKLAIKKDAQLLLQGVQKKGPALGLYDYLITPPSNRIDLSVSQYGVLGMWTSEQSESLEIPTGYWKQVEDSWVKWQQPDGGWAYAGKPGDNHNTTIAMTAAGVATLFITQDYNHALEGLTCKGNISNKHIEEGMEYIGKNFDQALRGTQYALYGIERIGVASGYKYINNIDWYQRGADYLIKGQQKEGQWNGQWRGPIAETALGVLFLARGRAPVVMNKLDYGDRVSTASAAIAPAPAPAPVAKDAKTPKPATPPPAAASGKDNKAAWNQRPRDAANVVRWIGRQAERDLNWQIVNLSRPAEELSDAPILYIAGSDAPNFSAEDKVKIKTYIENGGMVVANADCGSASFATGIRKLGGELFPLQEFRELPAEHVIYTNAQFQRSKWRTKPSIMAQSNGVRELIILIPQADPAKAWQTQTDKGKEELYQLMANIFLYAVDKQGLQYKGQTNLIVPKKDVKADRTIRMARLQYDGNWDPEPGGWRRMAALMLNDKKTALTVEPVKITAGALKPFKIAHLTGTTKFKLDEAARTELKSFVAGGGTLIVDAAGGSGEFNSSADTELRAMFPADATKLDTPLPADHAIYSIPDAKIADVIYRTFARSKLTGELRSARLRGIIIGGRTAVIYSPEDLSTGLVGNQIDGIIGYDPRTATNLMRNILLYANAAK